MTNQANPEMPVEPARLAEEWIQQINEACGYCSGWAIKTGDLLLQAKAQLPHGQWVAMWESRQMKFGLRTGEMLMRVARHAVLRNPKNFANFPAAWSIFYVLSQLPSEFVQGAIDRGVIHPDLKLSEARRLLSQSRAGVSAGAVTSSPRPFNVIRQRSRVLRSLGRQCALWPAEHREELAQTLETVAAQLRQAGNK